MTVESLVLVANAGDGSISVFRCDGTSLERLSVTEGLTGCSNFAVDTERNLVHAAVKGDPAGIVTLSLDRETGQLGQLGRVDLPQGGMNYLWLTRGGTVLLGASYGGGYGITAPVDGTTVGAPVATVEHPNLHSVAASSDGRFVYFVSLGADLVAQYALDDDLGLTPLAAESAAAPEGSGPRHLIFNDAEDTLYVMTEFSGEVLRFSRDKSTGELTAVDATNTVDPDAQLQQGVLGGSPLDEHAIWGADIHWGADEQTLWVSERTESTLAAVEVAADGSLTPPENYTVTETQPRGFATSPDGRLLVAAGERSTQVSLYAVDGTELKLLDQAETGKGANWVRFV
ncbi:lactonase family protein [Kocuria sp. JC486]|uniref:6-phosphogluconolactonase n=1 Tax=Kocuria soli TaxID=2485125 RepID=A0A3N3ZSA7_9MICC|nr:MULTISPECIES: beta-propeller fold lactonase family protein [Kocuria]NHU85690.1 lactonase family protein [Kocuria sp. JC486]ROZ64346.1 6-phosphogluconolactonase [Kocuria soli]